MMQGGAWGGVRYGRWMGRWVVVGGAEGRKEGGMGRKREASAGHTKCVKGEREQEERGAIQKK